ncbi:MAG: hypothetical protein KAT65_21920 [Methanophagales archaeon]|nr:hypothetical protein [Methanophagales archaeon]
MALFEILEMPEVIGAFFGAFFAVLIGITADIIKNHVIELRRRRNERVTVLKLLYHDLHNVKEHTETILKGIEKFGVPKVYLQKLPLHNWDNFKNSERFTQFLADEFFMDVNEKMRQIESVNRALDDYFMMREETLLRIAVEIYKATPDRVDALMTKIEAELKLKKAV